MGAADKVQLVLAQKGENYLLPEHVANSSLRLPPHLDRWLRVCPQQVAEQSGVGDVGGPRDGVDLIDGNELGR